MQNSCLVLKQYVLSCTTHLPILRISVIFSPVHPTFIHITLDFLMLVTYMLINQDWVFDLIRFPFSELSYGIAWSLTCANLEINLLKTKFTNFYFRCLVMRMIMLLLLITSLCFMSSCRFLHLFIYFILFYFIFILVITWFTINLICQIWF